MKRIATLGRPHTKECVTEFILQYSDDGELWRSMADTSAETQVTFLLTILMQTIASHHLKLYFFISHSFSRETMMVIE